MLENLTPQKPDALLALIKMHAADDRSDKIDLGVGVYRTGDGDTPVFRSIKAAEERLLGKQTSKAYLGPEGDMGFVHALMPYLFGKDDPAKGGRIDGMQTPGGTGAVRLALAVARSAGITRVHIGEPSWPNHAQIIDDLGLERAPFDHASDGRANIDALLTLIEQAGEGEAVLLHGCCHNPTGIDYTDADWDRIADAFAGSKALPILDVAYQGLGRGFDEDAYGVRKVAAKVDEALICYSCDKNFGLYRDRVGAFYVLAKDADDLELILSNASALARANWSMPPDHGAAAVREILEDEDLTADWLDEVGSMRERLGDMRAALAGADNRISGLELSRLADQFGLFALLKLSQDQIRSLREDHAIYMAGSGRINVAGLTRGNIDKFVDALAQVTSNVD